MPISIETHQEGDREEGLQCREGPSRGDLAPNCPICLIPSPVVRPTVNKLLINGRIYSETGKRGKKDLVRESEGQVREKEKIIKSQGKVREIFFIVYF